MAEYIALTFKFVQCDIFRLTCDTGIRLVLAPKYLDELRSHPSLSFSRLIQAETHAHIRGFEPFSENSDLFLEVIRKKLTQAQGEFRTLEIKLDRSTPDNMMFLATGRITGRLSDEASVALQDGWTDDPSKTTLVFQKRELKLTGADWHEVALYPTVQKLVAQMSCKTFLGDELCRNEKWLRVLTSYAGLVIQGAAELQLWSKIVRPIVAVFLNSTRILRKEVQAAREIMKPMLEQRAREKEMAVKDGLVPKPNDNALQWVEDIADGRPFDPVVMQLSLATVVIVTTADLLTKALFDICGNDALVSELREEVITVLCEDGMEKTSMYKLRLMDSFLKESQRLKPLSLG